MTKGRLRTPLQLLKRCARLGFFGFLGRAFQRVKVRLERRKVRSDPGTFQYDPANFSKMEVVLLLADYRPGFYPGGATLFKAKDCSVIFRYDSDPQYGWGELLGEGLSVHEFPGDHLGILREPNVKTVAELLKQILREQTIQR
jgi:thioesterase domain-containing protein